jgi:uridine kinase
MIVICVGGPSGGGKSTLIEQILICCNELSISCNILKTRDYYLEIPPGIDLEVYKKTTNFDRPKRLDFILLKKHILSLLKGESIEKPVYDRQTETRIGTEPILPSDVLLVDGTFSLYFAKHFMPELSPVFKIFIHTSPEILLDRRIPRDLAESRYKDEKEIREIYYKDILPSFFKYVEPTEKTADLIVNNDEPGIENFKKIAKEIVKIIGEKIELNSIEMTSNAPGSGSW